MEHISLVVQFLNVDWRAFFLNFFDHFWDITGGYEVNKLTISHLLVCLSLFNVIKTVRLPLSVNNFYRFEFSQEHLFAIQKQLGIIGLSKWAHEDIDIVLLTSKELVCSLIAVNFKYTVLTEELPLSHIEETHYSCALFLVQIKDLHLKESEWVPVEYWILAFLVINSILPFWNDT